MILIGLTGSIGMGKSATAKLFKEEGVPVYDADKAVHDLYAPGGAAVPQIAVTFPGSVKDGAVDRDLLSAQVVGKPDALKRLEAIVHPLVRQVQINWLKEQAAAGAGMVLLDVPLLFETNAEKNFTEIVVVSAPEEVQRARVLERPGMTAEKLDSILRQQLPDAQKRAKASFVIETSKGLDDARAQVKAVLAAIRKKHAL